MTNLSSAFEPFDEAMYAGMKPESIERLRTSHEKTRALFEKSATRTKKALDHFQRTLLITSFVGMRGAETGIKQSTAEKIVDEWILPHLAA